MSYAENPLSNPYAAPTSQIADKGPGQPSGYTGYSGFWRRFAAYLIDSFVLSFVGFGVLALAGLMLNFVGNDSSLQIIVVVTLYVLLIGGSIAYFAGMESSESQATLGKMAMGVRVTDLYGRRVTFGKALGRLFGKIISSILYIGFIMAAFTEKKQALHDMMAGTLVLKTR